VNAAYEMIFPDYWTGLSIYGVPEIAGNVWGCITFWHGC
jgi:hypothetical protein